MEVIFSPLQGFLNGLLVWMDHRTTLENTALHALLDSSEEGAIPAEIANRGKAAIQAFNAALIGGKQKLNWAKLMFVGQERVGKTSLLRNLTNQRHDPNEATTDGTDICVVETSDWVRLMHQPLYPSRFDQQVAVSVGGALRHPQNDRGRGNCVRKQLKRRRVIALLFCIILAASVALYFVLNVSKVSVTPASTLAPAPTTPTPVPVPTPSPTPSSYGSYSPTPLRTVAPTPASGTPASGWPSRSLWGQYYVYLVASVFTFAVCFIWRCLTVSPSHKPFGLLPIEPTTTPEVLSKMPVEFIFEVMN
jgi:hypothetical protein